VAKKKNSDQKSTFFFVCFQFFLLGTVYFDDKEQQTHGQDAHQS